MTSSNDPSSKGENITLPATHHREFNVERISGLIADLERELENAPEDIPNLQDLKEEIETLKNVLKSPKTKHGWIEDGLHSIQTTLRNVTATVEGEVLKDSPYIAEIGRILGMV